MSLWRAIGGHRRTLCFFILFVGTVGAYFVLSTTIHFRAPEGAAERPVVARILAVGDFVQREAVFPYQRALSACAAGVLQFLGFNAVGDGRDIRSADTDFAVTVTNGCDAIEVTLLLCLAILLFPAPLGRKLAGAAAGALAIALVNFLRIVSLWIIGRYWNDVFEFAHFNAWPFVLVCSAIGLFSLWLRGVNPPADPRSGHAVGDSPRAA